LLQTARISSAKLVKIFQLQNIVPRKFLLTKINTVKVYFNLVPRTLFALQRSF